MPTPQPPQRWNMFARELQDLLAIRGLRLGHLKYRAGIHPQKVSRLQRSLIVPKFHVLSPDEIERISTIFQFTQGEQLRLRAAILTTAIEQMLFDRIELHAALTAAEAIFPIMYRALDVQTGPLVGIKGGAISMNEQPEDEANPELESILAEVDRAYLALFMSRDTSNASLRQEQARQAESLFAQAIRRMEDLPSAQSPSPAWQAWHDEIEKGLTEVRRYLQDE